MPEAQHSVLVPRPPEEVFAFLADGENDVRWRPSVLDIERVSGDGVGAVYRQGVKGPFGRRVPADFEITDLQPTRRIAFRATTGPVRPEGAYELAAEDGSTRVTFSLRAEPDGFARMMSPMVARSMRSEVRSLENLEGALA
jgi:carbon monoxide dehydrogenase subunit G